MADEHREDTNGRVSIDQNEHGEDREDEVPIDHQSENASTEEGAQALTAASKAVSPETRPRGVDESDHTALPVDDQTMEPKRSFDVGFIRDIPVHISVELGRRKLAIKDVLGLGKGSAIVLSNLEGEALDIRANNRLIAKGEVLVENDKYGIRIKEIITSRERLDQLMR